MDTQTPSPDPNEVLGKVFALLILAARERKAKSPSTLGLVESDKQPVDYNGDIAHLGKDIIDHDHNNAKEAR